MSLTSKVAKNGFPKVTWFEGSQFLSKHSILPGILNIRRQSSAPIRLLIQKWPKIDPKKTWFKGSQFLEDISSYLEF